MIVVGCGGHARFVISMLRSSIYQIEGLIDLCDNFDPLETIMGVSVIGGRSSLAVFHDRGFDKVILAIGDNSIRKEVYDEVVDLGFNLPCITHPSAFIDASVVMAQGNIIGPNAVIGAEVVLGSNNIINSAAVIEHQTVVGDHCHISPSATICGCVCIGDEVLLGANSTVIPKITIASDTIVGAGATLIRSSHASDRTLVGNPARELIK